MTHISITDTEKRAIRDKEFEEYEQKRLRGTGYELMKDRDRGYGWIPNEYGGGAVEIAWHVEEEKIQPTQVTQTDDGQIVEVYRSQLPKDKFVLRIGDEQALLDKEAFQKLFRWV